MHRLICVASSMVILSLVVGCGDSTRPTDPRSSATDAQRAAGTRSVRSVNMHDACDGPTFNAALGPGTCTRQGGMKFDQFIAKLTREHAVQAWKFAPAAFQASLGQTITAINRGGETHTFTRVAAFGGGIVPLLNALSDNTVVAPECTQLEPDDFVAPGGTYTASVDQSGTLEFQCCIHPWMRAIVNP